MAHGQSSNSVYLNNIYLSNVEMAVAWPSFRTCVYIDRLETDASGGRAARCVDTCVRHDVWSYIGENAIDLATASLMSTCLESVLIASLCSTAVNGGDD
jgi:hypothetical protein